MKNILFPAILLIVVACARPDMVFVDAEAFETMAAGARTSRGWTCGAFTTNGSSIELSLHDMTGFDGRCDAVCLTRGSAISIIAPKRSEKTPNGSVSIENTPVENRCSCAAYSVRLISTIWKASMTSPSLMSL